jgi:homoserine kinase type II
MLQLDGRVYEVFAFVRGVGYNRSIAQTEQAGRTLAQLHELLRDLAPSWKPVIGAYHAAVGVLQRLSSISSLLAQPEIRETTRALSDLYRLAAQAANRSCGDWRPDQLIHADWHPGNMIFSADSTSRVIAVLDFDSVRMAPPIVDLANAALQFSILRGQSRGTRSKQIPDEIDLTRFQALCHGYHQHNGQSLRPGEIRALPWLMIEALVTEAAVTIAATGKFGPMAGGDMLRLVHRKALWIQDHAATMIDAASRAV